MIEVTVDIPIDGEVVIDVKGASGPICQKLTEDVEKELGNVKKKTKKPEYYATQTQQTKTSQKQ